MTTPYGNIKTASEVMRTGNISPVEIVGACLERIEEVNSKLNAFVTVLAEQAQEASRTAEAEIKAGEWRGRLHGIPIAIKDFYDTAGVKTTAAFEHFRNRVPVKDAVAVGKFKEAGAIIVGKTNMHRLGEGTTGLDSYFGPVRNPWNPKYIPGGSSSGSAAAVAAGMCYATLDTDAIGSCRLPASCCGVVGFKGTYGLISAKGILDGEQPSDETILWLSHPAITTRSVADTAIILGALTEDALTERSGSREKAISDTLEAADRRKLQIGVANNFQAEPEVRETFRKAVETIRSLGHDINSAAAPLAGLERDLRNIKADRESIASRSFTDIDIYLLPTTTASVPSVEDARNPLALSSQNTAFANYYGLPAISVPCGFDCHGLPLGLQMVAKPWDEMSLLSLAHQFEQAAPWNMKHPAL